MKKLILTLFTLSLVNMSATAQSTQINQRPNGDHYLTPDSYGNPIPLDVCTLDSITGIITIGDIGGGGRNNSFFSDVAQPCYSDTLLTIVGISVFFHTRAYDNMNGYVHIADTDFNIYRTVKVPQRDYGVDSNYTELFFNQPINVKGRFMVIWDNPKPNVSNVQQYDYDYNFHEHHDNYCSYSVFVSSNIKDVDAIYQYLPYLRICKNDTLFDWKKECEYTVEFGSSVMLNPYPPRIYYLFPIFGELDTTLEYIGCEADNSIDSSDVGLVNNGTVDMYTHIFPNPVKEELNIQCSFKIEDIEVYNALGQKVFSKRIQGYNATINTSSLTKGSYTLRVKTQSGVVNKKFIVE